MYEEEDNTTKKLLKQSNVGIGALKNWQRQPSQNKGFVPYGSIGHAYNMNQDFAPKQAHMQDVAIQPKLEALRREAGKYGDDPFQRNEFLGSGFNFRPDRSFGRDFLSMSQNAKKELGENETNRFALWNEYHKLNPYLENKTDALNEMQFGKPGWAQNRKTMVGSGTVSSNAYSGYGDASAGGSSDYKGGSLVKQLANEGLFHIQKNNNYSKRSSYSDDRVGIGGIVQDLHGIAEDLMGSPEFSKVGRAILKSVVGSGKANRQTSGRTSNREEEEY
jgi:hypothetical protein